MHNTTIIHEKRLKLQWNTNHFKPLTKTASKPLRSASRIDSGSYTAGQQSVLPDSSSFLNLSARSTCIISFSPHTFVMSRFPYFICCMSALFVHVYCILYLQQLKIHILHPINNPKLLIFSKSIPFCKHYKKKAALPPPWVGKQL